VIWSRKIPVSKNIRDAVESEVSASLRALWRFNVHSMLRVLIHTTVIPYESLWHSLSRYFPSSADPRSIYIIYRRNWKADKKSKATASYHGAAILLPMLAGLTPPIVAFNDSETGFVATCKERGTSLSSFAGSDCLVRLLSCFACSSTQCWAVEVRRGRSTKETETLDGGRLWALSRE
jgi:hypothetical protein